MTGPEQFGRHIKAGRALAGLTQVELAAALAVEGVKCDPATVSLWEKGKRQPGTKHFVLMCRLFDWAGVKRAGLESMLLDEES